MGIETDSDTSDGPDTDDAGSDTTGPDPDLPHEPLYSQECNIHFQDCPAGEKCLMYKLGFADGGLQADRQFCSPVASAPLAEGELCSLTQKQDEPLGFQDDCEAGFFCDGVETQQCSMLCRKAESVDDPPLCEFPRWCATTGTTYGGARCLIPCVPLSADGDEYCSEVSGEASVCGLSSLALVENAEGLDWHTRCNSVDGFPLEAGEPCAATCSDPGLTCAPNTLLGSGCTDDRCCTQVCDVNGDAAECTEMGHECVPMFPDHLDDPTYGHFGYCGLPG